MLAVRTRYSRPGDAALVMSTWLRSWKRGPHTRSMPVAAYYEYARGLAMRLLERRDVKLRVAHDPADDDRIFGWLCWSQAGDLPVVHYAYVKQEHRRSGVLRGLAAEAGITDASEVLYTIKSPQAKYVAAKVAGAEYLPLERFLA